MNVLEQIGRENKLSRSDLIGRYDYLESILNNRVSLGPNRDPWPIAAEMVEIMRKLEELK